jgi:hypothetical protein
MKVIPRKLVCCLLIAGVCFATTEVGTAFGQKTEAPPSPDKPSPASSELGCAAVPTDAGGSLMMANFVNFA